MPIPNSWYSSHSWFLFQKNWSAKKSVFHWLCVSSFWNTARPSHFESRNLIDYNWSFFPLNILLCGFIRKTGNTHSHHSGTCISLLCKQAYIWHQQFEHSYTQVLICAYNMNYKIVSIFQTAAIVKCHLNIFSSCPWTTLLCCVLTRVLSIWLLSPSPEHSTT